jgi:hypothetical protein
MEDMKNSRQDPPKAKMSRTLGIKPVVTINNISGETAWVIILPAPIFTVSSVGLDKVGQLSFSCNGEYKSQQSPLLDKSSREFELDTNTIYYTVFFECNNKWKLHVQNRKLTARKYDINLLPRHVLEARDFNLQPINNNYL